MGLKELVGALVDAWVRFYDLTSSLSGVNFIGDKVPGHCLEFRSSGQNLMASMG